MHESTLRAIVRQADVSPEDFSTVGRWERRTQGTFRSKAGKTRNRMWTCWRGSHTLFLQNVREETVCVHPDTHWLQYDGCAI